MSAPAANPFDYRAGDEFSYAPLRLANSGEIGYDDLWDELAQFGLSPEWLGAQPHEVDADQFWRFQYDRVYFYVRKVRGDSQIFPVEFRTVIHTVGEPTAALKDHIENVDNGRLRWLFDNSPSQPGFMSGFNFTYHADDFESQEIDADDANNLGIPQFEVAVWQEGQRKGHSSGFFDPFAITEQVPFSDQQEVWGLSWNESRGSYQVSPEGRSQARERAKNIRGKEVHINGRKIGSMTQDGRAWLKKSYARGPTYRGNWSREAIVQNTAATYAAIRDGGNLYKVAEDDESVYLVTAALKPDDFDAADPDSIDAERTLTGLERDLTLGFDSEETVFNIRDIGGMLSHLFNTPSLWDVSETKDWPTTPR